MQIESHTSARAVDGARLGATPTNQQFLLAAAGAPGVPTWVCGFRNNPQGTSAPWSGRPYRTGDPLNLPADQNTYFSAAALRPGEGRKKSAFERMLVLVADDADSSRLGAPASYIIETSPGKQQIGYLLKDDHESRDEGRCTSALKAMVNHGLAAADKSGNNTVRYVRLPVGANTKYEGHPQHQVLVWNPTLRYTLSEALAAFGVRLEVPAEQPHFTDNVQGEADDSWMDDLPDRLDVDRAQREVCDGSVLHQNLIRLAAHHAAKGMSHSAILALLAELMDDSAERGSERWKARMAKLPETVASAIQKFGSSYDTKVDFSERGNANLLAQLAEGNLRYVIETKTWMYWVGGRWETDNGGQYAFVATDLLGKHYAGEAAKLVAQLRGMDPSAAKRHQKTIDTVLSWEKVCRSRKGIDNTLALAARHPDFAISASALDTDPHLLGVQNGVVNLRTGELRADAREDFVTRRCTVSYRPDAKAPRWEQFVNEVTGYPIAAERTADGDVITNTVGRFRARPDYAAYLQRASGYSITGLTVEHKMFTICNVVGSNGKNVYSDIVLGVLGSYGTTVSPLLLLAGKSNTDANSATPALTALAGVRHAVTSEPRAGSTFDNAMLKALTGESQLPIRGLNKEQQPMRVGFHLWLLCNAKPQVENLEQAVIGRILMLPFDRQWNRPSVVERDPALPDGDKHLASALEAESEGILAWLVAGAVRYFAEGLEPCKEVVDATSVYFKQQDPVGKWLAEHERCAPLMGTTATDLFNSFQAWRIAHETAGNLRGGDSPATQAAFSLKLRRHGVESAKQGVVRYGVSLMSREFDDAKEHDDELTKFLRFIA